ncbi:hypothetical protein KEJ45_05630 [Candidatus Bathyarchaeota archaeon]|nr:hypothetical protein [Candidatus Bathyarchaeota archaeon]
MRARAILRLEFPSEKNLKIINVALAPEAAKPATPRSKVHLKIEEPFLVLIFDAKDTVALRAAVNSYLRWVSAICNTLAVLEAIG